MDWISVEDRLPEDSEIDVLVWDGDYQVCDLAYYENGWWHDGGMKLLYHRITHWQPLPAPPNEPK